MHIPVSPVSIDREKLYAFLDDLGIDRSQLRDIQFGCMSATLTYYVRGDGGVIAVDGRPLTATVVVPVRSTSADQEIPQWEIDLVSQGIEP